MLNFCKVREHITEEQAEINMLELLEYVYDRCSNKDTMKLRMYKYGIQMTFSAEKLPMISVDADVLKELRGGR